MRVYVCVLFHHILRESWWQGKNFFFPNGVARLARSLFFEKIPLYTRGMNFIWLLSDDVVSSFYDCDILIAHKCSWFVGVIMMSRQLEMVSSAGARARS